jgi:hypothetical protein
MAQKTQQIMWTALPNGLTADGSAYRLSVLVSPRLTRTAAVPATLDEFPDLLDWPAVLAQAGFAFEYGGAVIDTAELVSVPRSEDWTAVFLPTTFVRARAFEDRRGNVVLSYPLDTVHDFVRTMYSDLVRDAGDELPEQNELRRYLRLLAEPLTPPPEVLRRLRSGEFEFDRQDPRSAFELLQAYHRPLSAEETVTYAKKAADDPREDASWRTHRLADLPQPDDFKDLIDFHQIVSSVNQYHDLLRRLGLVLDFEIPVDDLPGAALTDRLRVLAKWPATPQGASGVETLEDTRPATVTHLEPKTRFAPVVQDPATPVADGFLRLDERFRLIQVDVDGAGIKVKNFARSVATMRGADKSAEQARAGAPALRSAGLMLVETKRGKSLTKALDRSGSLHDAEAANANIDLFQEDLIRGYHVDVLDETTGRWQSLCRRDGSIELLNTINAVAAADEEGMVRLGATQAADGSNPDVVKLYEGLFAWTGWSLTAPAPGNAIATEPDVEGKDTVAPVSNTAPPGMPFEANFTPRAASLPSLRYGRRYRMRVRVVDLAHNAIAWTPKPIEPAGAASPAESYLRYEPVEPPALALARTEGVAEAPAEGEAMARLAIRSFNDDPADNTVPTGAVARRHVAPPRTSAKQAETHGKLDTNGRIDPTTYGLLSTRDMPLDATTLLFDGVASQYAVASDGFTLPYLPDPFADQVAFRFLGPADVGMSAMPPIPYYPQPADRWPDALPFQIRIVEQPGGVPKLHKAARVLEVPLAKADIVRLRLSHVLPDDGLEQMGVWEWFRQRHGGNAALVKSASDRAKAGHNWLLTPWLDIELVHAVQKPLVKPAIQELIVARNQGQTFATPVFVTPADSRSTDKLDLFGRWNEPDDNLGEALPRSVNRRAHAIERKLSYLDAPGVAPPGRVAFRSLRHEFGDTRYRRVLYRLEATSRFREFMPPAIRNAGGDAETNPLIKVLSDETVGWVPNAAPPPAPDVVYVVPTFGWTRRTIRGVKRSWRGGGGLRVYLNRQWFVTGFNEMLAVVLPPDNATKEQIETILKPFVTQWGTDPIWAAPTIKTPSPALNRFPLAVTAGPIPPAKMPAFAPEEEADLPPRPFSLSGLINPSLPQTSPVRLNVAPHLVQYDEDRQLWFCDIVVHPGHAYYPFIRLALARYHPISAPGAHLSPVVTTEFVQLSPDRLATVTAESKNLFSVALYGHAYTGGPAALGRTPARRRQAPIIEVVLERRDPKQGDLGWEPVAGARVAQQPERARRGRSMKRVSPRARSQDLIAKAEALVAAQKFDQILGDPALLAVLQPPLIWSGRVTVPGNIPASAELRIMVQEYELHRVDSDHVEIPRGGPDPRRRLVFAEAIPIRP